MFWQIQQSLLLDLLPLVATNVVIPPRRQRSGSMSPVAIQIQFAARAISSNPTMTTFQTEGFALVDTGTVSLLVELFECQTNPWIGNRNAPAVSFCEGFDLLDSAVVLVSPWPNNGQSVFEHRAQYVISEPIPD